MKKRWIAITLIVSILFSGCTGNQRKPELKSPFRFYYRTDRLENTAASGASEAELRETAGHETDYVWILTEYLRGPESEELSAPFQTTTTLVSANRIGTRMELVLSDSFSELNGIDLTVACACITLTCLEFSGVESVSISTESKLLNGKTEIVMREDDLLLRDLGATLEELPYVLYFSDTDNRYLIGEEITLDRDAEDIAAALLNRLISGPKGSGMAETIPVGTRVLSLDISDGVCSVNFSGDFVAYAPRSVPAQRLTLLSVTNTLTQLEGVDGVALYVDGEPLQSYGALDMSQLLTFEERAIGPARVGMNEMDLDLYLPIQGRMRLSRIPVRIQQMPNGLPLEQLLNTLMEYRDQNGYHSPIPQDTQLLDLRLEDNRCYVNLSGELLTGGEAELAIESICATLISSGLCSSVQVLINGNEMVTRTWSPHWIDE